MKLGRGVLGYLRKVGGGIRGRYDQNAIYVSMKVSINK